MTCPAAAWRGDIFPLSCWRCALLMREQCAGVADIAVLVSWPNSLVIRRQGHEQVDRVAIFVDVQNVYYTTRQAFNRHFDYNAFWSAATRDRQVVQALAYAIDRDDERQKQFQNILRGIGFGVQLKSYIRRADGSSKGDWDVGIAIDVMDHAAEADVVVLVSGDGDFALLVDRIRRKHGLRVEVYGVEALTAQALVKSASAFIPIGDDLLLNARC